MFVRVKKIAGVLVLPLVLSACIGGNDNEGKITATDVNSFYNQTQNKYNEISNNFGFDEAQNFSANILKIGALNDPQIDGIDFTKPISEISLVNVSRNNAEDLFTNAFYYLEGDLASGLEDYDISDIALELETNFINQISDKLSEHTAEIEKRQTALYSRLSEVETKLSNIIVSRKKIGQSRSGAVATFDVLNGSDDGIAALDVTIVTKDAQGSVLKELNHEMNVSNMLFSLGKTGSFELPLGVGYIDGMTFDLVVNKLIKKDGSIVEKGDLKLALNYTHELLNDFTKLQENVSEDLTSKFSVVEFF